MTSLELAQIHADINKTEDNFVCLYELLSSTERKIHWIVEER